MIEGGLVVTNVDKVLIVDNAEGTLVASGVDHAKAIRILDIVEATNSTDHIKVVRNTNDSKAPCIIKDVAIVKKVKSKPQVRCHGHIYLFQ